MKRKGTPRRLLVSFEYILNTKRGEEGRLFGFEEQC